MLSARRLSLLALVAAGLLLVWFLRPHPEAAAGAPAPADNSKPKTQNPKPSPVAATTTTAEEIPVSAAADLNLPNGTIARDLQLLNDVFTNWRLDFPHLGHPVGDNAEITAALTGDNPLRLPLIPRDHRAINAAGELCDRWGTPFRFHALSGERMELRSAGPDRKFGTADDALLTPP